MSEQFPFPSLAICAKLARHLTPAQRDGLHAVIETHLTRYYLSRKPASEPTPMRLSDVFRNIPDGQHWVYGDDMRRALRATMNTYGKTSEDIGLTAFETRDLFSTQAKRLDERNGRTKAAEPLMGPMESLFPSVWDILGVSRQARKLQKLP